MFLPTDPFLLNSAYQGQVNEAQYNNLIDDVLRGKRDLDDVLDFMNDSNVNPDQWLDNQVQELEFVIDNGIKFAPDETGLFLPQH